MEWGDDLNTLGSVGLSEVRIIGELSSFLDFFLHFYSLFLHL